MKQLFKTTLLATAVAVTCGSAVAGTVAVTKQTHSYEGLEGVTANQTSNAINYTLAAAYRDGDKVTFTFPAGSVVTSGFPAEINVPAVVGATADASVAGLALGQLNSSTDSVTYRVTSVTQPGGFTGVTTIGAVVPLSSITYKAASVRSAAVTVTVSSETVSGDVLDNSGTRTATVAESKSQFGTAAIGTKFDGVIDVAQVRKAFNGATNDQMEWTITNPTTTGWLNMATVNATNGTVATVYGEAGKMADVTAAQWSAGGTRTFTAADAKLAISYAGETTNDTITFTPLTGTKAVVIEAQEFTTDFVYNYTSAGAVANSKTVATGAASGEWTLNGATVNVPYMPYGANVSQVLYVSNSGTQSGDISATVFDDTGTTYDLGVIGTANANTVTKVAGLVKDALEAKGFKGSKASITITVNAPESDITVNASFNVGGSSRQLVVTDQYKGK